MRRFIRNGFVALLALVLWPITALFGIATLIRRATRSEPLVGQRDVAWVGRRAIVATTTGLALWAIATGLVALASLFIAVPDI